MVAFGLGMEKGSYIEGSARNECDLLCMRDSARTFPNCDRSCPSCALLGISHEKLDLSIRIPGLLTHRHDLYLLRNRFLYLYHSSHKATNNLRNLEEVANPFVVEVVGAAEM